LKKRHFYPDAPRRFPALVELSHLNPLKALLLSSVICTCYFTTFIEDVLNKSDHTDFIWQLLYWKVSPLIVLLTWKNLKNLLDSSSSLTDGQKSNQGNALRPSLSCSTTSAVSSDVYCHPFRKGFAKHSLCVANLVQSFLSLSVTFPQP
jgi:hypothetical protein